MTIIDTIKRFFADDPEPSTTKHAHIADGDLYYLISELEREIKRQKRLLSELTEEAADRAEIAAMGRVI